MSCVRYTRPSGNHTGWGHNSKVQNSAFQNSGLQISGLQNFGDKILIFKSQKNKNENNLRMLSKIL